MSQWQYKLFEFDIREELETDKEEFVRGKDTKKSQKEGFSNPEVYKVLKNNYTQPTEQNPIMNADNGWLLEVSNQLIRNRNMTSQKNLEVK